MSDISPALQTLFNNIVEGVVSTWYDADIYTITPYNADGSTGTPIYLTTADFDILWNGNLYQSLTILVDQKESKVQAHWKLGFDNDTWTVVFMPRPIDPVTGALFPDTIGSVPWIQAAR